MPRRPTETRRRILESAYRFFYREGFQRTGVEDVAEAAGITKRTLYNHYPSKDGLIAGVLEAQADLAAVMPEIATSLTDVTRHSLWLPTYDLLLCAR